MKFKDRFSGEYSYGQKEFIITGETSAGVKGKAVLPTTSPEALAAWFLQSLAASGAPFTTYSIGMEMQPVANGLTAFVLTIDLEGVQLRFAQPVQNLSSEQILTIVEHVQTAQAIMEKADGKIEAN